MKAINKFSIIPNSIENLVTLENLSIKWNRGGILIIPDTIGMLPNLQRLVINDTCVQEIPDSIGTLENLHTFVLFIFSTVFLFSGLVWKGRQ